MSARRILGVGKWLVPGLTVAAVVVMFASCSTEVRSFGHGHQSHVDAGHQGGATDSGADSGFGDSGSAGGDCDGQDDGTACGHMSGFICVSNGCRESSCGDGYVDVSTNEQCDDGNTASADGCEPETCSYSCVHDADCDDGFPCNGEETCNARDHFCERGIPPDTTLHALCILPVAPVVDAGTTIIPDAAVDSGSVLSDGAVTDSGGGAVAPVEAGPAASTDGFCKAGLCVPEGCGNGLGQPGEQCDDGNEDNTDGCKSDCTFTCVTDADCDDYSVCSGTESCNTHNHRCEPGGTLACDDGDDCTDNNCDAITGCVYPLHDEDADGHVPSDLCALGDDCDDHDATTYTGAGDLCGDGIDNDCNDMIDDIKPTWYCDQDGDDYSPSEVGSQEEVCEPTGSACAHWTTRVPRDLTSIDCYDYNAAVNPAQTAFSTSPIPDKPSLPFDWNCNGVEDEENISTGVSPGSTCGYMAAGAKGASAPIEGAVTDQVVYFPPVFLFCPGAAGYTGASRPNCGSAAEYTYCDSNCSRVASGSHTLACR